MAGLPHDGLEPGLLQHLRQHLRALYVEDHRLALAHAAHEVASERSEEHTSELQSHHDLVCRLLLEKKKKKIQVYNQKKKEDKQQKNKTRNDQKQKKNEKVITKNTVWNKTKGLKYTNNNILVEALYA